MRWGRRRSPEPEPARPREPDRDVVVRLARQHLPPEHVDAWVAMLRPAVALVPPDEGPAGPVVARLGGTPSVPAGFEWPVWEGHGPLSFVGELLLEPLARHETGLTLPSDGRLLLFYFDGGYDDDASVVGTWEPESTRRGARLVHVVDDGSPQPAPDRVPVFDRVELAALDIVTIPNWEHPAMKAQFAPTATFAEWTEHPVLDEAFTEALDERHDHARHQVGGWAWPIQGPVEGEVAGAALDNPPTGDAAVAAEQARWSLLVQVDSERAADMTWGDVGMLYWLARPDDLARGDLSQVGFTWQCT